MKKPVKEISDGIFSFAIRLHFRLNYVYTYAAVHDRRVTLFDTGPYLPGTYEEYQRCLNYIGMSVQDIDRILVSHFHADHCGLAGLIKEKSGGAILISRADFEMISSFAQSDLRREKIRTFYSQQGIPQDMVEITARYFQAFKSVTYPFQADGFLTEGTPLTAGQKEIRVLSTPGHTRGHLSFHFPGERILLAGDCILPHITPNLSPDLLAPSFLPLRSFLESLDWIARLPVTRVYPAHGLPFETLQERVEEIKKHHQLRKEKILRALKKGPKTTAEISISIFGSKLPDFDKILAFNETYVHLQELEEESLVRRSSEQGVDRFTTV